MKPTIRFSYNGKPIESQEEAALSTCLPQILSQIETLHAQEMKRREHEKLPYGDTGKFVYPVGKPFPYGEIEKISIVPLPAVKGVRGVMGKPHLKIALLHETEQLVEMKIVDPRCA